MRSTLAKACARFDPPTKRHVEDAGPDLHVRVLRLCRKGGGKCLLVVPRTLRLDRAESTQ